jgi:conjugal transfer/entry exclusion protein
MNLIYKETLINEYSENTTFSEYFMESVDSYFTEYASKDKDEITKWMDKRGYWYDGNNPKKKKECNRMYQFLKQHKFDPKDETYETEIEEKGKKKRIRLVIDPGQNNNYKGLSDTMTDSDRTNVVKGLNATLTRDFRNNDMDISIGSKELKGKQHNSQVTLKHEEGHANALVKNNYKSIDPPDDTNREARDLWIKSGGPELNAHDDQTSELYADKYSAQHTKMRNKNAGKKKSKNTRKITDTELKKHFIQISRDLVDLDEKYNDSIKKLQKELTDYEKHLSGIEDYVKKESEKEYYTTEFLNFLLNVSENNYWNKKEKSILDIIGELQDTREEIKTKLDDTTLSQYYKSLEYKHMKESFDQYKETVNSAFKELSPDKFKMFKEHIDFSKVISKNIQTDEINVSDDTKNKMKESKLFKDSYKRLISEIQNIIDNYFKNIQSCKKCIYDAKNKFNQSSEFRYKFARQFINEYFVDTRGDDINET